MKKKAEATLEISVDARPSQEGLARIEKAADEMQKGVKSSAEKAGEALDKGISKGAETAAKKLDGSTKSIIQSIQRATAMRESGDKGSPQYYETLAKLRGADVSALQPYLTELKRVNEAHVKTGIYAKEMNFALRGVPAQFTDIATSLAAGQNPMTVFLQQGGQLKDMFGGIGPAARAMGGYVAGLINPFTLGAAAVAALGLAAYRGAEQQEQMAKAIITTNNAAGTTVGQMQAMAGAISAASDLTKASVTDSLMAIVATGKVSTQSLGIVAEAVAKMDRAGVQTIEDSAKAFASLGKEPVEASLKLNEATGYLTASVFEQIKALDDQGRTSEAAKIAQEAYATASSEMADRVMESTGNLTKVWKGLGDAASWAWTKMMGIGVEDGLEKKLADAKAKLQGGGGLFGNKADAQYEVDMLQIAVDAERERTKEKNEQLKKQRASVEWMKEGDKYLSKSKQTEKEVFSAVNLGAAAGLGYDEIAARVAAIREKHAEKKTGTKDTMLADLRFEERASNAGLASKTLKELDSLKVAWDKGKISQQEYLRLSGVAMADDAKIAANKRAVAESIKEEAQAMALVTDFERNNRAVIERIERSAELALMTDRERVVAEALYRAEDDFAKLRERIIRDVKDETAQKQALAMAEAELAINKAKVSAITEKSFDQQRSFEFGWQKAFRSYSDAANNHARMAETVFTSAADAMADAGTKLAMRQKVNWRDMDNAFASMIINMQLRAAAAKVVGGIGSLVGGWFGGFASSGYSDLGSGMTLQSAPTTNFMEFASGGDHAGGYRIVGENGPELEATGPARIFNASQTKEILGGDGGGTTISMPITIDARGADASVVPRITEAMAQMESRIYRAIPGVVAKAQVRNRKPVTTV